MMEPKSGTNMESVVAVGPKTRQSEYVQMKRDDYKRIKNNFSILKGKFAKEQQQNKSLQNLYSVLSVKDEELKVFKSRAHKFEMDYIRAQAQLSNLALKIGRDNGGKQVDYSALIQSIDDDAQRKDSGLDIRSIPKIVEDENTTKTKAADKEERTQSDERTISGSSDLETDGSVLSGSYLNRLLHENNALKEKIKGFESNQEAWSKFQAQEEQLQLIQQLRHELARVQVQNSELRLLLTAKQNENVDALTQKLDNNITKVQKLEKQLLNKHEMVGALQKQFQRLKAENEKLSRAAEGAVGGLGQDDQDGDQTSIKESIDVGYESCNTGELFEKLATLQLEKTRLEKKIEMIEEINEKHVVQLNKQIDQLEKEKQDQSESVEKLQEVIRTSSSNSSQETPRDTSADQPITRLMLQEEVTRLTERIQLYEQEQRAEKERCSILEGQMSNIQSELERRTEEVQKLRERDADRTKALGDARKHNEQLNSFIQAKENMIAQLNQRNSSLTRQLEEAQLMARHTSRGGPMTGGYSAHHLRGDPMIGRHMGQSQGGRIPMLVADGPSSFPDLTKAASDGSSSSSHSPYQSHHTGYHSMHSPGSQSADPVSSGPIALQPRFEVADGSSGTAQTTESEVAAMFECERCLRVFEDHEEHKYKQHIKKCQD